MDLGSVDEAGNMVPGKGPAMIPWDDPYHYFRGLPVAEEPEPEEDKETVSTEDIKDGK